MGLIADAVTQVSKGDRAKAGFILWQLKSESDFDRGVGVCECERYRCDPRHMRDGTIEHQAHGYAQGHLVPSAPNAYSDWWELCNEERGPLASARLVSRYYRADNLEQSFARMKGIMTSPKEDWVVRRAAEARRLARQL
jgi:hypothetical protein